MTKQNDSNSLDLNLSSLQVDDTRRDPLAPEPKKDEGWKGFVKTLVLAITLAVAIRSILFEPFHIPSGSMKPGLLVGDYIFVSKMSYGYSKHSFPFSSFNLFDGRILGKEPKRGDVAVFRYPKDTKINYIKRIVGLPGDKIRVADGVLYVNDEEISKKFVENFIDSDGTRIPMFGEIIGDKRYLVLDQYKNVPQDNTEEYVVPAGHYFAMGDNRDNSQDSRFQNEVGFIPAENLVGRATVIFISVEDSIWKFWKWPQSIRFDRFFKRVH